MVSKAPHLTHDLKNDICNIDLHQACDEELGMVLSHHVTLDMQMQDNQWSTEMNQYYLLRVQIDEHFAKKLRIIQNMSEAEKQFMKELLHKVEILT
jgi:DNA-directed RNA polymerase specialized sigma54-like protein